MTRLLAVPNVSEGRDAAVLDAIGAAFAATAGARCWTATRIPDHHRAVFSLAGGPRRLCEALWWPAPREAIARIDLRDPRGQHPHIGAIDVAPVVYLSEAERGAACAEALVTADRLGRELELPVFLYGVLAGGRASAELRRGGIERLAKRIAEGELKPDYGPPHLHPSAGAVLVSARPPLVAFNVELAPPADLAAARAIAAAIREGGAEGLPGLRAIGVELHTRERTAQVSMNVERPDEVTLAADRRSRSPATPTSAAAEIVALVPSAALEGFPADLEIRGFDPARQIIENHLD